MKRLGVFLLHPDARSLPRNLLGLPNNSPVPIYTPGWREALKIVWEAQEHNTMSPARARTRTASSGDECHWPSGHCASTVKTYEISWSVYRWKLNLERTYRTYFQKKCFLHRYLIERQVFCFFRLWGNCNNSLSIKKTTKLQNRAARILTSSSYDANADDLKI